MKRNQKEGLWLRFLNSPISFFVLIGLYPTIFLVSKNWFAYEINQLLFLLVIPLATGILGFLFALALKKIRRGNMIALNGDMILGIVGLFFLFVLLESTITKSNLIILFSLALAFLILILIKKLGFKLINLLLILLILMGSGELVISLIDKSDQNEVLLSSLQREADDQIKFKKKPNIYLVHLESYHSPEAMRKIYNFDNRDFINRLEEKDFFVSQNNFANYSNSLNSVGSMLLQQHHYYKLAVGNEDAVGIRDIIGGREYNPTISILKNNGYKIKYIHPSTYLYAGSTQLDYFYPPNRTDSSLSIFQSNWINEIHSFVVRPFKDDMSKNSSFDEFYKALEEQIGTAKTQAEPTFYYISEPLDVVHTPANGTYSWQNSNDGWVDQYVERVESSNDQIIKSLTRIVENDPDGIIVLYGDHGAWRYRDIWKGLSDKEDINDQIYGRKKIGAEELALDIFGVFSAIRYPDGNSEILNGETNINIFRKLFSELSETDDLIREKPANESYINMGNIFLLMVKEGKPLDRIQIINNPSL